MTSIDEYIKLARKEGYRDGYKIDEYIKLARKEGYRDGYKIDEYIKLARKEGYRDGYKRAKKKYAALEDALRSAETYVHHECYTCKHWRPKTETPCGAPGDGPCNAGAREAWEWNGSTYEEAINGSGVLEKVLRAECPKRRTDRVGGIERWRGCDRDCEFEWRGTQVVDGGGK